MNHLARETGIPGTGSTHGISEQALVRQAARGDEGAMHALYRRYAPRVYAVVRRIAGEDALADDWAQEAWIRAFRSLPSFRGDASFSTWLHRVAVNSALQGKRSRKRHDTRERPLPAVIAAEAEADPAVLRIALERAVERLPDGMRHILVLHDVEGFTHEEIGDMLGIASGTSKSQLSKARAKMREMLRSADIGVEGRAYAASEA
ncbi:MAG TPA: sigma-70 family RNA polymerase sigma factor [Longimicrobiaceae bacterium]|nr:sigma-70 family RNA polymerase sigma factor [Longimicrobiaceae bacterium]